MTHLDLLFLFLHLFRQTSSHSLRQTRSSTRHRLIITLSPLSTTTTTTKSPLTMSHVDGSTAVIEAPVTLKAYLMCAFASFGGIFFGYDSGYINGKSLLLLS